MTLGPIATVFYCGFTPRRAARANLGLSLGQAAIGAAHWLHPRAVPVLESACKGVTDGPEVQTGA